MLTEDDQKVGRLDGAGVVTASHHDPRTGNWRAAFLANLPSNRGSTECEWVRAADQLTFVRRDRDPRGGEGVSELRLRKIADKPAEL